MLFFNYICIKEILLHHILFFLHHRGGPFSCLTWGENHRLDNYSPCPSAACIIQVNKQFAGLPCSAHGQGPWESAYWPHGGGRRRAVEARRACATDWMSMRVELVKMFSTREESRRGWWWWWGRQKEGRSGFLQATSNRFPGKTYLHMQDSATSYLRELWHVRIEQMGHFFRAFLQKFPAHKIQILGFVWFVFRHKSSQRSWSRMVLQFIRFSQKRKYVFKFLFGLL